MISMCNLEVVFGLEQLISMDGALGPPNRLGYRGRGEAPRYSSVSTIRYVLSICVSKAGAR